MLSNNGITAKVNIFLIDKTSILVSQLTRFWGALFARLLCKVSVNYAHARYVIITHCKLKSERGVRSTFPRRHLTMMLVRPIAKRPLVNQAKYIVCLVYIKPTRRQEIEMKYPRAFHKKKMPTYT